MKARILYIEDFRESFTLGRAGASPAGHTYVEVDVVDYKTTETDPYVIAERIWRLYNVVEGDERPVELKCRSMSEGDIVEFTTDKGYLRAYIARSVGFELTGMDGVTVRKGKPANA